eukprot:9642588-Lingulodinium_polyedra.AAC.1
MASWPPVEEDPSPLSPPAPPSSTQRVAVPVHGRVTAAEEVASPAAQEAGTTATQHAAMGGPASPPPS